MESTIHQLRNEIGAIKGRLNDLDGGASGAMAMADKLSPMISSVEDLFSKMKLALSTLNFDIVALRERIEALEAKDI